VNAERVRRRVIPLCEARLAACTTPDERYWLQATLAEAHVGIGDEAAGAAWLERAREEPVAAWMHDTTERQLADLRELLTPSPLEMIRPFPAGAG